MNKKPLISVIISVYNTEKYLSQCLDSVLAQTYHNLEIILVDDGSTDDSGKICDEYAQKDARIKVIHQSNHGVSRARNMGLEVAKGEYIGFVDSDDYIEPDMYEYLYSLISKDNAAMTMCNICENENFHSAKPIKGPYILIPFQQIFEITTDWMFVSNKLFKRDFIGKLIFNTETSYGEDYLFIFELAKSNKMVVLGNQAKYHYCLKQNPNSLNLKFQPSHLNKIILGDECLAYAKQHHWEAYCTTQRITQLNHTNRFLMRLASSQNSDNESVRFLTGYIKKHLWLFVSSRGISLRDKLFGLICCVNFNSVRFLVRAYYKYRTK